MFPWQKIDTVLLDMDGTLLDLHFDNHFWLNLIPQELAKQQGVTEQQATQIVKQAYQNVAGTLDWYCLDYWQNKFNLDIMALHHLLLDRIQLRQDSLPFLKALKSQSKHRLLVTNAHPKSLHLKLSHTGLEQELDAVVSSHELGYPKEAPEFWEHLFKQYNLQPQRCLFIDDNETILTAAKNAGVKHLLGIANPDSKQAHKEFDDFPAIHDYHLLLDELLLK